MMGMYTKVSFIIPIKTNTPKKIREILIALIEGDLEEHMELPKHKFFETTRFHYFARTDSFYFTGTSNSAVKYPFRDWRDGGSETIVLHIDSDFKHYDEEIELFLDWVKDYMEIPTSGFIGYTLYEMDERPTLWFIRSGEIIAEYNAKGEVE